jgi:F subunit of K+-transporting ATPase (Potass_KdpF)
MEHRHAGSTDDCVHDYFLRRRASLCSRLREVEVAMSHTTLIVLILTVATLIYLVITLLYPEKF